MDNVTEKPCFSCKHRKDLPGNCHIECTRPPLFSGVGEVHITTEMGANMVKAAAEIGAPIVVRMKWRDCGVFPLLYDGATVVACANHEPEVKST